jgi:wyosine [tRNA(Phe)-imidazoG37] synthetase (radical SAM superfamily)
MDSIIYGPVSSWRLGRSLGVDLFSGRAKTCSFDCIYCEWGATVHPLTERKEFVTIAELKKGLEQAKGVTADYATFAGNGEPTLASNLGEAIETVKSTLKLPVAVLTNSSFMPAEDVRRDLSRADLVVAKIDAPHDEIFKAVNKPFGEHALAEILEGIKRFRSEYKGRLALQMMFVEANKGYAKEMAKIARELSPDEVEINTPLRPCGVKALTPTEIAAIREKFSGLKKVVTVYEVVKRKPT